MSLLFYSFPKSQSQRLPLDVWGKTRRRVSRCLLRFELDFPLYLDCWGLCVWCWSCPEFVPASWSADFHSPPRQYLRTESVLHSCLHQQSSSTPVLFSRALDPDCLLVAPTALGISHRPSFTKSSLRVKDVGNAMPDIIFRYSRPYRAAAPVIAPRFSSWSFLARSFCWRWLQVERGAWYWVIWGTLLCPFLCSSIVFALSKISSHYMITASQSCKLCASEAFSDLWQIYGGPTSCRDGDQCVTTNVFLEGVGYLGDVIPAIDYDVFTCLDPKFYVLEDKSRRSCQFKRPYCSPSRRWSCLTQCAKYSVVGAKYLVPCMDFRGTATLDVRKGLLLLRNLPLTEHSRNHGPPDIWTFQGLHGALSMFQDIQVILEWTRAMLLWLESSIEARRDASACGLGRVNANGQPVWCVSIYFSESEKNFSSIDGDLLGKRLYCAEVYGIFLDITRAYDEVITSVGIKKLHHLLWQLGSETWSCHRWPTGSYCKVKGAHNVQSTKLYGICQGFLEARSCSSYFWMTPPSWIIVLSSTRLHIISAGRITEIDTGTLLNRLLLQSMQCRYWCTDVVSLASWLKRNLGPYCSRNEVSRSTLKYP